MGGIRFVRARKQSLWFLSYFRLTHHHIAVQGILSTSRCLYFSIGLVTKNTFEIKMRDTQIMCCSYGGQFLHSHARVLTRCLSNASDTTLVHFQWHLSSVKSLSLSHSTCTVLQSVILLILIF
jgi:hypothetical protein